MVQRSILALVGFVSLAAAKKCMNITVPVEIMAGQGKFAVPEIMSNQDVTTFSQNFTSIANGTNYTQEALLGYQNVQGTYNLGAKFCTPDGPLGSKPVVQVLTHGIGFDKSYWDLPYNNFNYSYIGVAVGHGYCTLSFDRFGIGNSSHADPYNVVQAPAEVSALYNLNSMLRKGTLPGVDHAFNESGTIVNVGHSFGSQKSYMLSTMYPNITDAVILTGFSFNGSYLAATLACWNSRVAAYNQPLRFGKTNAAAAVNAITGLAGNITLSEVYQLLASYNLSSTEVLDIVQTTEIWDNIAGSLSTPYPVLQNLPAGYLTWDSAWANQYAFLFPTGFDPEILFYAEATKQPYTIGELFTLGGAPAVSPFTGPVQIVTGQQDAIYCGGECLNTGVANISSIPAAAAPYFSSSSNFSVFIQPATGHALNLHYNSTAAYDEIASFLRSNSIVPS